MIDFASWFQRSYAYPGASLNDVSGWRFQKYGWLMQ
jgi:hypothetical protein